VCDQALFRNYFDVEGKGVIDEQAWVAGVHRLQEEDPKHFVVAGVRAFVRNSLLAV
jgi:hypothetical protein